MGEFDEDGDGALNQQEFLRGVDERKRELEFQALDRDGDGFVSEGELKDLFVNIGAVELANGAVTKEMIKEDDLNGDGKISWEEFTSFGNLIYKGNSRVLTTAHLNSGAS